MKQALRIGVFDSGVGGLDLLFHLRRHLPNEDFFYFADTLNHPYGEKSQAEVTRYVCEIIEGLLLRRVKLILIACNTATVVFTRLPAEHPLKQRLAREGVEVIPMISPAAIGELALLAPRKLLLCATRLTIASGALQDLIGEHVPDAELRELAAPAWVEAVEHPLANPAANARRRQTVVTEALATLGDFTPDAVYLGCTHFPHLWPELRAALPSGVRLINPARSLVHFLGSYLALRQLAAKAQAPRRDEGDVLFTNGSLARLTSVLEQLGYGGRVTLREVDIRNDFSGKQVDVLGFGATGQSLLRFLCGKGAARLVLRDSRPLSPEEVAKAAPGAAILLRCGADYLAGLDASDVICRSPGVPANLPELAAAKEKGVPVQSDIDLFLREAKGRKVAISGTNGKTTTTLLTRELFACELGERARVVGNVGCPVLDELAQTGESSLSAIELSSFQLEELAALPVEAAILLNITPDHLDRHGGMLGYVLAKGRLLALLDENAYAVYNIDSEPIVNILLPRGCRARLAPFSRTRELSEGACFVGTDLVFRYPGRTELRLLNYKTQARFFGAHNFENVMGAGLAAYLMGLDHAHIRAVLEGFVGVRYRIEHFARLSGVDYYDDAKGTNPDATIKAVEAFERPIRLVAGGANKGFDFTEVAEACAGRVIAAYLFGEIAPALAEALGKLPAPIPCRFAPELEDATALAHDDAKAGEVVLFSPACASPKGQKYTGRGDRFKARVLALGENELTQRLVPLNDPLAH